MALVEIQVPDIGDFDEVAVIEVLVKAGDQIKAEQSLITVESDKASMEIPSSHAGVLKELRVNLGDKVKQGSIIAVVESAEAAAPAPVAAAPAPVAAPAPAAAPAATPAASGAATQIDIRIPDIGDFKDVAVIEMLVKVGDAVTAVATISDAIREQSTASANVAQGLEKIADMTERNTCDAQQSAAAAEELDSVAARLRGTVEQFRV